MRSLIALLIAAATPAWGQAVPPPIAAQAPVAIDPAMAARIDGLASIVNASGDFDGYFAPGFHAALPKAQWDAVVSQMTAQMGRAQGIDTIVAVTPWSARVRMRFDRGIVNVQIAADPAPPHRVVSLYFTGVEVAGDSFARLTSDFRALPGASGFGIYTLGDGPPHLMTGLNPAVAAPLGSAFKLWVLGELAREVMAGERRWTDVVPVGPPSLPSGITQSWPAASPVTLHTLATLMISISDNTATDTLVALEGTRLDRFLIGGGDARLAPILTTRQMFAMKSAANADIASAWASAASPAARRALLDRDAVRLAATPVDAGLFSGNPVATDTLEWFASPVETAVMLDRLRRNGGDTALAILAINPGTDAATRARFAYVGYKGGSEPGVITLTYLVRRTDGRWLAVVGNWHRSDAAVEEQRFALMMARALVLASETPLP